jgi:hypothetical protein
MDLIAKYTNEDLWKGIILFGLNAATYKMALAKSLLDFTKEGKTTVSWDELSKSFLHQYQIRLKQKPMPQQGIPTRVSVMERIIKSLENGTLSKTQALDKVGTIGLEYVIPCFQTIGLNRNIVHDYFYGFDFGKKLVLKDSILSFTKDQITELEEELFARWSLLEGAFAINHSSYSLANDIRDTYIINGYDRINLTGNVPFLLGYQGNTCFYCGETMQSSNIRTYFPTYIVLSKHHTGSYH